MQRVTNTVRFLRMAANELRRLAERVPEIADELQSMARQLDTEADDLRSDTEAPPAATRSPWPPRHRAMPQPRDNALRYARVKHDRARHGRYRPPVDRHPAARRDAVDRPDGGTRRPVGDAVLEAHPEARGAGSHYPPC